MVEERRKDYPDFSEKLLNIEIELVKLTQTVEFLHKSKNEAHDRILERLDRHSVTLYGNGRKGLVSNVQSFSDTLSNFKKGWALKNWIEGTVLTGVCGALAIMFNALLKIGT